MLANRVLCADRWSGMRWPWLLRIREVPNLPADVGPVTRKQLAAGCAKAEGLERTIRASEQVYGGCANHCALSRPDLKGEGFVNGSMRGHLICSSFQGAGENGCG